MIRYMKRNILILFIFLFFLSGVWAHPVTPPQKQEKSKIEQFMQGVSRIKSNEIDYAYISTSMFKQMFSMLDGDVTISMAGKAQSIGNVFSSIKSLRRFMTTGHNGYKKMTEALKPFLNGSDTVMGMELMAENRVDEEYMVIYSDSRNVLMIQDDGDYNMSVVFIVGLPYAAFLEMMDEGMDFGF